MQHARVLSRLSCKPFFLRMQLLNSLSTGFQSAVNHSTLPTFRYTMATSKEQPVDVSKVLIFGAGNFGSCLADHLGDSDHKVFMWSREEEVVKHFNKHHKNPAYLKDYRLSSNITAIGPDMPGREMINEMDVLLFAIPTQFLRCARLHWHRGHLLRRSLDQRKPSEIGAPFRQK